MANYYTLGAYIPELSSDDTQLAFTTASFVEQLKEVATASDKKLVDLVLLRGDNRILISLLTEKTLPELYMPTAVGKDALAQLVAQIREESDDRPEVQIPSYLRTFAFEYLSPESTLSTLRFPEDQLYTRYLAYVDRGSNAFLKKWFRLETNIANLMAYFTALHFGLEDKENYLVGNNEVSKLLKEGNLSDILLLEDGELVAEIKKIAEGDDLLDKEKGLDMLKWRYLDSLTFADPFSINAMLAYLLKSQLLERWAVLDKEQGEKRFRELVMGLKKEGKENLDAFVEAQSRKSQVS